MLALVGTPGRTRAMQKAPSPPPSSKSISALSSRFDKRGVPSYDEDECESEEETESPSLANSALTRQTKKKGKKGKRDLRLSAFTMSIGSVGQVKGVNRSDLESHTDACVVGKEALLFDEFDSEVTVSGYDPSGETKSLRSVSAALGYVIPETGKIVLLIIHQAISLPTLDHNLLSTMQMRLHDVVVNETPKLQSTEPTSLSHTISVRGDEVDDVLVIPLDLFGVVSCFPRFKPSQDEFETFPRYELNYEIPVYDPTVTFFSEQEESMTNSYRKLKPSGDSHPKMRQVCSLRQKELEIKKLTVAYSDTSAKLQDLSIVLENITLLAELKHNVNIADLNVSSIHATMRDKGGVDAATLANHFGIGIEVAKRKTIMTTQMGVRKIIHPSLNKRFKTNDRQLRYRRLHVTLFTDTMYSTIISRQGNKAAQVFCDGAGWGRAFPMKKEKEHTKHSLCYSTEMACPM
jgi:hypothetical protein